MPPVAGSSSSSSSSATAARLLVLHGPSGTGKSAAVLALAEEAGVNVRTWKGRHNDAGLSWKQSQTLRDHAYRSGLGREYSSIYQRSKSEMDDFRDFLFTCQR